MRNGWYKLKLGKKYNDKLCMNDVKSTCMIENLKVLSSNDSIIFHEFDIKLNLFSVYFCIKMRQKKRNVIRERNAECTSQYTAIEKYKNNNNNNNN